MEGCCDGMWVVGVPVHVVGVCISCDGALVGNPGPLKEIGAFIGCDGASIVCLAVGEDTGTCNGAWIIGCKCPLAVGEEIGASVVGALAMGDKVRGWNREESG